MTQLVDPEEAAGPPPSDGLSLVGETKAFLKEWQRMLLGGSEWLPERIEALRERARVLESRARAADVSGLAHHLQSCEHCFWNGDVDKGKLAHCLRNVSEVAWQWRHDLRTRSDVGLDRQGQVSRDRLTIDPPTLLAPPSVEMFESTPPPAHGPTELDPALEEVRQASLLSRLFGSRHGHPEGEALPGALAPAKRQRASGAFPSLADAVYSEVEPDSEPPEASTREAFPPRRSGSFPWAAASATVVAMAGIGVLVATLGGPEREVGALVAASSAAGSARGSSDEAPAPPLPRETIDALLASAHGYGGIESPELADWLDEEARELSSGPCPPGAIGCSWLRSAAAVAGPSEPKRVRSLTGLRPSWLEGLEVTPVGGEGDPGVREAFEFHTRNAIGREAFQELLFRCGGYRDVIHAALDRYGLPRELLALPMVASGCVSDVESSAGARGLWQLTPAAARAYHLRVKAQVLDERIDPAKGTDAAVRLLEDLHRKLGSWELAVAAYQLGPLALLSGLRAAGDDARFAGLGAAGHWPPELREFVPKVQAFALALANLEKFRFEPAPLHAAESTAVLEVPPGTRLGLVARAAASSTTKIRELNPDLIADRVPDWPGERFLLRVPKETEIRARDALPQLIASADHADECVPHAFDWGRQRFTNAMASRCEHAIGR